MHTTARARFLYIFDGLSNFGNLFLVWCLALVRQSKINNQSSLLILNIFIYIYVLWCKSPRESVDEENEQNFVYANSAVTKQPNETSW